MSFLKNIFKPKGETNPSTFNPEQPQTAAEYGEAAARHAQAEIAAEQKKRDREQRQKNKMVKVILEGNQAFANTDREIPISEAELQAVYDQFNHGEIDNQRKSQILRDVATPAQDAYGNFPKTNEVYDSLFYDEKARPAEILEYSIGRELSYQHANPKDVETFIQMYPTPVEYQPVEQELLDRLREHRTAENANAYQTDMDKFKHLIFGKRQEYFEAIESLEADAMKHGQIQASRERIIQSFHPEETSPADYRAEDIFETVEDDNNFDPNEESPIENSFGYWAPEVQESFREEYEETKRAREKRHWGRNKGQK